MRRWPWCAGPRSAAGCGTTTDLAHATVQAFVVAYSNGVPALRAAASAKTNDRGEYSIFWLPAGEYMIATVRDATQVVGGYLLQQVVGTFYPGTPLVTQAVPVNLRANENLEGIDFTHRVSKPVRVSGTIVTTLPPPPPPAVPAGNDKITTGKCACSVTKYSLSS